PLSHPERSEGSAVQIDPVALAFHSLSSSASRSADMPASLPCDSASSSGAGRVSIHTSVSWAVFASGRNVRPAASALSILRRDHAARSGASGTHTGIDPKVGACGDVVHARTLFSCRNSGVTHVNVALLLSASRMPSSMLFIVYGSFGPVALKM